MLADAGSAQGKTRRLFYFKQQDILLRMREAREFPLLPVSASRLSVSHFMCLRYRAESAITLSGCYAVSQTPGNYRLLEEGL